VLQQEALQQQGVSQQPMILSQQELLDFGATFVKYWFTGVAKGPAAVHQALVSTLHDDVVLKADSVRQDQDMQASGEHHSSWQQVPECAHPAANHWLSTVNSDAAAGGHPMCCLAP
jgi:hypothetical protein